MKNYDYGFGFKPISPWGYVGYSILWSIPVVGWIFWLVAALGSKQRNVKNYARSFFCLFLLGIAVAAVAVGAGYLLQALNVISVTDLLDKLKPGAV